MSQFHLSEASLAHLDGVSPTLAIVPKRAIEITPYDFGVVDGLRTLEEHEQYLLEGKSTVTKSLHLPQKDGWAHAFDIAVYYKGINAYHLLKTGQISRRKLDGIFRKVIQAHFTAAIELGIQIEAGGLWMSFTDNPHIQLNQKYYGQRVVRMLTPKAKS